MAIELGGLHHVTAVTGNAAGNAKFYTQVLGMRLVKKSVNQDDVSAYHLFYADEDGSPGTDMTFFDWPNSGPNVPGTGSIAQTGFRVANRDALDWWVRRFDEQNVQHGDIAEIGTRWTLPFTDPEGQSLALVADDFSSGPGMKPGTPWSNSPVPADMQIRGLHHVTLVVDQLGPSAWTLVDVMGFRLAREYPASDNPAINVMVFESGPGGPGTEVYLEERPELQPGWVGIGGVHHVAFRVPDDEEHRQWRERVASARLPISGVIDRFYFRSLYFREPGRILYEIATDGPGFATDEEPAHLGEALALPPFLEPRRAEIEAGLRPLDTASTVR